MELKVIAKVSNDFKTKFGLPRQGGLSSFESKIIFEKEYSVDEAFRGITDFSHLIVIWGFSEAVREDWSPTVRPPRLGGNKRIGVFATRSPFRPNAIAVTVVKLVSLSRFDSHIVLTVEGGDMMNGTPIFDVKPYLPFSDSVADAVGGFADMVKDKSLNVEFSHDYSDVLSADKLKALKEILSQDPRPSYQEDPERIYGFEYANREVKFRVSNGIAEVIAIV